MRSELLRDRFGLGTRRITHDGDHGIGGLVMRMIKITQVLHGDFFHAFDFTRAQQCVWMRTEHRFLQRFFGDVFRLGVRFFQVRDQTHFFPCQNCFRKERVLQHACHDVQSLVPFRHAAQSAQGYTGTILVETAAELRADVRNTARNIIFAQTL